MRSTDKIITAAPGKLILSGEYAVLEGEPALVCAVDREALVQLTPADAFAVSAPSLNLWQIPFYVTGNASVIFPAEVEVGVQKRLNFFKTTFEYVYHYCRDCSFKSSHFHISIDTDAFYDKEAGVKLGFGSSAALTVALVKAVLLWAGADIKSPKARARIFRLALAAHRKAQNNLGSGIDIAASSYGGVLRYRALLNNRAQQEAPTPLKIWPELPGLIIFTGRAESTRRMVSGVHELKKSNPGLYREIIHEMGRISGAVCDAYTRRATEDFLPLIEAYYALMLRLGEASNMPIISPVHRQLHQQVTMLGGVYKPSGAGSGDIGVAFATDNAGIKKISQSVEQNGFICFPFQKNKSENTGTYS